MKKLILLACAAAALAACGPRNANRAAETAELHLWDSIKPVEGLGHVVKDVYEGVIPAADAPGVRWVLTLYRQKFAESGVYDLRETFLGGPDGREHVFDESGKWHTESAVPHNIMALTPFEEGGEKVYFQYLGDSITMLDRVREPIVSAHNYTLRRTEEQMPVEAE